MMSSTRLRNSGLKCPANEVDDLLAWLFRSLRSVRRLSATRNDEPMFEVMMMTVFLKSTVRPLAVGEAPVIHDLQQDVEDVRVRLLDFVEQHDGVGTAADLLR